MLFTHSLLAASLAIGASAISTISPQSIATTIIPSVPTLTPPTPTSTLTPTTPTPTIPTTFSTSIISERELGKDGRYCHTTHTMIHFNRSHKPITTFMACNDAEYQNTAKLMEWGPDGSLPITKWPEPTTTETSTSTIETNTIPWSVTHTWSSYAAETI